MSTVARRIFLAHLELSYRLGRKVTLAEFGELVAKRMGRDAPFTAAAVSRWEAGVQMPSPEVIEAIAALTRTDPGWISHGEKTAAPGPPRVRADRPVSKTREIATAGEARRPRVTPAAADRQRSRSSARRRPPERGA
jgi:transcriptional regulator with XRE-family HTH domain